MNKLDEKKFKNNLKKLKGPIIIFGAGGFIGINLLNRILLYRKDVFGISHDRKKNWRFLKSSVPAKNLIDCDITNSEALHTLLQKIKPQTIFNLAAYGAYAKQTDYKKIYATNTLSTVNIIEELKKQKFSAYVHAGSQSEYGLNAKGPREDKELIPNSHYAVSKVSNYYLLKYYGKVEKLPVVHLRLYSAYGPWEEPDRLMPILISKARSGLLPSFVNPKISRDFVYVDDIINAFILVAKKMNKKIYGEAYNVASGKKTTIRQLALLTKKLFSLHVSPVFSSMEKRNWDLIDWYGNGKKIQKILGWKAKYSLNDGLKLTAKWQDKIAYSENVWNLSQNK